MTEVVVLADSFPSEEWVGQLKGMKFACISRLERPFRLIGAELFVGSKWNALACTQFDYSHFVGSDSAYPGVTYTEQLTISGQGSLQFAVAPRRIYVTWQSEGGVKRQLLPDSDLWKRMRDWRFDRTAASIIVYPPR